MLKIIDSCDINLNFDMVFSYLVDYYNLIIL